MNQPQGPDTPDQYGVVGHPVSHSWSPFIHGMFAKATAQNLVYRLFDVAPDNFRREALHLFASGVRGLNVTLPHKQAAAELVNELTPRAERAQAVNTIAFFEDTSLLGDNTDGLGLTADLERNLLINLAGKRVLILGAGGAVRGVLGPLLERDLGEVIIANRTPDRARKLATEFADLGSISGCGFRRKCRRVSSAKRRFATTWRTAAAIPLSRCGRNRCMRRAPPRGGACWSSKLRSRSCSGAESGLIPAPFCRPWRSTLE